MPYINNGEHHFVDSQANILGELSGMPQDTLWQQIRHYHDLHEGKDISPDDADYSRVANLYRELFRRQFQKGKDFPVGGFISIDHTQPVNGTATMVFARRLGRQPEVRKFIAGFLPDGRLSYQEVPTDNSLATDIR